MAVQGVHSTSRGIEPKTTINDPRHSGQTNCSHSPQSDSFAFRSNSPSSANFSFIDEGDFSARKEVVSSGQSVQLILFGGGDFLGDNGYQGSTVVLVTEVVGPVLSGSFVYAILA